MAPVTITSKFPALPWNEIFEYAPKNNVEPELVAAFILQESSGNQFAARFEPRWKYWNDPERWALTLKCTTETERAGQATSYGFMQIMGAKARDLGFSDWFGKLYQPSLNVSLGCQIIGKLLLRYREPAEVISAYNAGSPRKMPDGTLSNQPYVDSVIARYWALKKV